MWEEAIKRDCITEKDIYAKFNRSAFVRGDIRTRWETYVKARQWGIFNADEVRAFEDMNPREDGGGQEYAEPPNTAGGEEKPVDDPPPPTPPADDDDKGKGKGKRK
jgi:phage portal protein BeeE